MPPSPRLAAAGLGQSGLATDPTGAEPQVFDVDGCASATCRTPTGSTASTLPAGQPWRAGFIDPSRIVADAATARAKARNRHRQPPRERRSRRPSPPSSGVAEAITASGQIDLVVGHHAHVLQPIEQVNGVWVVYGLGNLVSNLGAIAGWPAGAADGAIAEVRFDQQPDGTYVAERPVVQPTWVDIEAGWLVGPVLADSPIRRARLVKHQLEQPRDRTAAVLGDFLAAA